MEQLALAAHLQLFQQGEALYVSSCLQEHSLEEYKSASSNSTS